VLDILIISVHSIFSCVRILTNLVEYTAAQIIIVVLSLQTILPSRKLEHLSASSTTFFFVSLLIYDYFFVNVPCLTYISYIWCILC